MAKAANKSARRMDSFLAMQSGRSDLWRDALTAAQHWASGQGNRAALEEREMLAPLRRSMREEKVREFLLSKAIVE